MKTLAFPVLFAILLVLVGCPPGTKREVLPPVLESVLSVQNGQKLMVGQNTDANFSALPSTFLQFRVRASSNDIAVVLDNQPLKKVSDERQARNDPNFTAGGFYWLVVEPLAGEFFIVVSVIPQLAVQPGRPGGEVPARIEMQQDGRTYNWTLQLNTSTLSPGGELVPFSKIAEPGDIFSEGDNSRDFQNHVVGVPVGPLDRHSVWSVVARKFSVGGWLVSKPNRNQGSASNEPGASEDWQYALLIDNEYIKRNYGFANNLGVKPLSGSRLSGNPSHGRRWPYEDMTWNDIDFINNQPIDAGLFLLPFYVSRPDFAPYLDIELNAFHKSDRGTKPTGWIDDMDPAFFNNAWPRDPMKAFGSSKELDAGDYVIITGTLWQDSSHDFQDRYCWQTRFPGQAGWMEIHPVDAIRLVRAPKLQKTTHLLFECYIPGAPLPPYPITKRLRPMGTREPGQTLHFSPHPDPDTRFTQNVTVQTTEVVVGNEQDELEITIDAVYGGRGQGGCYKIMYLLWWE